MMIGDKEYYQVKEELACSGCVFHGRGFECDEARRRVDCFKDGIIWKAAEKSQLTGLPGSVIIVSDLEQERFKISASQTTYKNDLTASEREHLEKYPHYYRDIRHLNILDIYRVLDLFSTGDSALDHAAKKILAAGKRGAKNKEKDIKEAIDTLTRRLEMLEEDKKC